MRGGRYKFIREGLPVGGGGFGGEDYTQRKEGIGGSRAFYRTIFKYRCKVVSYEVILRPNNKCNPTLLLNTWGQICGWDLSTPRTWVCPDAILLSIKQRP